MSNVNIGEEEIANLAASFQLERIELANKLYKHDKDVSHQDATNVWLFKKLAEMQLRIDDLEHKLNVTP